MHVCLARQADLRVFALSLRPIHFVTTLYDASVHWEVVEYAAHLCATHRQRHQGQNPVQFHCLRDVCCHAPYYEVPQIYNRLLGSLLQPAPQSWVANVIAKKQAVGLMIASLSILGTCTVALRRRAS